MGEVNAVAEETKAGRSAAPGERIVRIRISEDTYKQVPTLTVKGTTKNKRSNWIAEAYDNGIRSAAGVQKFLDEKGFTEGLDLTAQDFIADLVEVVYGGAEPRYEATREALANALVTA